MSDRNQPLYDPNHYPHQVTYGQTGAQPRNGQQGYQQTQQPLYYPVGTSSTSYAYPMVQAQPDEYGMVPAHPTARGRPQVCAISRIRTSISDGYVQGYATVGNDMGHFMPGSDTAPWANPSQNAMYYGATDPAHALTPQPAGNPSLATFPIAQSSTPQAQGYMPYPPQQLTLASGDGMVDSRSVRYLKYETSHLHPFF